MDMIWLQSVYKSLIAWGMILSDRGFLNEVVFFWGGGEGEEGFIYMLISILSLNIHQC